MLRQLVFVSLISDLFVLDWNEQSLYDKRRHSNVPNYFFPKMDRYPDLRTATLVFLVSSLGA